MLAATAGAGISIYLLVEYLVGRGGICLTGSGCDLVQQSAFAYPLGIPLPLFGLFFYVAAAWVVWRTLQPRPLLGLAPAVVLAGLAASGFAVSLALTAIEAFVIHAFCTWCLGQAIASVALALTALFVLLRGGRTSEREQRESSRERKLQARAAEREMVSLRRLTLAGGGVTTLLVATILVVGAASSGQPTTSPPSELAPAGAPRLGTGPVTVVEFADFECPGCAAVSPILDKLANEGRISLVYRHFPLPQHPNAVPAARAAEAANRLGKFWPMHDLLFEQQQQWASLPSAQAEVFFRDVATRIGLDPNAWSAAYASSAVTAPIDTDAAAARTLSLPGTPAIYIDGHYYRGSLSEAALRAATQGT